MIRFARAAVLLAALAAATPALAQDWRIATITGAKPGRTIYVVDRTSVVRDGNIVRFNTESIYETITEARRYDRILATRQGDCTAMSASIVGANFFAGGAMIPTDIKPNPMLVQRAGSAIHTILSQVCGITPYTTARLTSPERDVRAWFAK